MLGDLAVQQEFTRATIVRSSILYGHEDRFLNILGSKCAWWYTTTTTTIHSFIPYHDLGVLFSLTIPPPSIVLAWRGLGLPVLKGHTKRTFYPLYVCAHACTHGGKGCMIYRIGSLLSYPLGNLWCLSSLGGRCCLWRDAIAST